MQFAFDGLAVDAGGQARGKRGRLPRLLAAPAALLFAALMWAAPVGIARCETAGGTTGAPAGGTGTSGEVNADAGDADRVGGAVFDPAPVPSLAPVLRTVTPAVVKVESTGRAPASVNRRRGEAVEIREAGSGVVYDAGKGLVITNHHVINNADAITATLTDGRVVPARRVGTDPDFDLAVIKLPMRDLPAIRFGDSTRLEVGDVVLAIGYPGNMAQSVTAGIVSGLHRTDLGIEQQENFIQTDAAVYPGNSGGALVNINGDLVGINTAYIGSTSANPGVGFAIPVNIARIIAGQLIRYGDIRRGTLGIVIEDSPSEVVRELNLAAPMRGAVITGVTPGSAGQRAGLKAGDVVIRAGETPVRDAAFVRTRIAMMRIGETAQLTVWRGGKEVAIRAVIAARLPQVQARRGRRQPT